MNAWPLENRQAFVVGRLHLGAANLLMESSMRTSLASTKPQRSEQPCNNDEQERFNVCKRTRVTIINYAQMLLHLSHFAQAAQQPHTKKIFAIQKPWQKATPQCMARKKPNHPQTMSAGRLFDDYAH